MIEGKTERAFKPHLLQFLKSKLAGRMPNVDFFPYDGRIPKEDKLRRTVEALLRNGKAPSEAVIALTDVYTGTNDFLDAADAKRKMQSWVGKNDKFYPHAAQHDFEASLLPFLERYSGAGRAQQTRAIRASGNGEPLPAAITSCTRDL